jgi:dihydroorotase-like cyclic amidohydrolase
MSTVMPQTAEQAHAVARQWYRAMLTHADAGRDNMTATAAACFANAALLAQMYELRQIRMAVLTLLDRRAASDVDSHDLHPEAPKVPYDGFAVNGRRTP